METDTIIQVKVEEIRGEVRQARRAGMKSRKIPAGKIPDGVVPQFCAWLAEVGNPTGKTAEQVWALWAEYAATCRLYDQSPVKSEFLSWYAEKLDA